MGILQTLIAALFGRLRPYQSVRDHDKQQAYGPWWSLHRVRRIQGYSRRRPRRRWR
jgi:hypothetical protein